MTGVGRGLGGAFDFAFEGEADLDFVEEGLGTFWEDLRMAREVVEGRRVATRVVRGGLVLLEVVLRRRVRVVEVCRSVEVLFRLREVVELARACEVVREELAREVVRGGEVVGVVEFLERVELAEGRREVVRPLVELEEVRRTVVEEVNGLFLPFPPLVATPLPRPAVALPNTAVAVTTVPFFLAKYCPPSTAPAP